MNIYTHGYDSMLNFLLGGSSSNLTLTDDHIQYVNGDITIVIGFNSLRCLFIDNKKFASITMIPAEVNAGSLTLQCETKFALYNSEFRHDFPGLYIDGGSTFQMSTLYDFDFGIIKDIMPKYLRVLEALVISSKTEKKVHQPTLQNAIESVRKYAKMYAEE